MMEQYIDLGCFRQIYIVDLCSSLCKQAQLKVKEKGWKNVTVVEADACQFVPPEGTATLVTFSYSLSSESLPAGPLTFIEERACTGARSHLGGVQTADVATPTISS